MYVAQRELKYVGFDNRIVIYKPGDEIPNFDSWDIHARRAHLNLEWVRLDQGDNSDPVERGVFKVTTLDPAQVSKSTEARLEIQTSEFKCSDCEKAFDSKRALGIHVSKAHK